MKKKVQGNSREIDTQRVRDEVRGNYIEGERVEKCKYEKINGEIN